MTSNHPVEAPADVGQTSPVTDSPTEDVLAEFLVEEVSIDGMCGVY